ncbi:hypothetical protein SUGI_0030600 [Cryptomeria japonica]|uniref:probable L-gulonolactone oxidase 6 n=1 Tax=Cryptomeria japonica TaxID=3369 RepID=UPI0024089B0A|nr:probable L-gulonolactone oxidase 6 [Cryptomeria japonica]GLJ06034.1 hypothetical protein SUGI_0030600 [Cryptomeria japonica]
MSPLVKACFLCLVTFSYQVIKIQVLACSIPPPTVECNGSGCSLYNNQGLWEDHSPCKAAKSLFPTSEAQLVAAVAEGVKNKQKINVISGLAHSHTRLACVGEGGLIISTRDFASKLSVDKSAQTITVDPGVIFRDLLDEAAKADLAFPTSTSWDGVSAAGSISTGAHGSGLVGKGSAINEYVVGMRLVVPASASEGYARVIQLTEGDEDLKAARFSLGTLGAISQITFALEPMFKRSVSLSLEDDAGLEDRLESFLRGTEFANIYWYVGHAKAFLGKIDRVSVNTPGNGINKSSYQPNTVAKVEQSAAKYDAYEANEDLVTLCNDTGKSMNNRVATSGGFLNDGENFTGYPVVGFNHLMQAAGGCQDYHQKRDNQSSCTISKITDQNQLICSWDRRVKSRQTFDLEIRVPLSRAREAIIDVKKIRDLNPNALCALEGSGIVMRTIKKSEAFLGPPEDMVTFEVIYYRYRKAYVPKFNMDIYQEIEQLLIEKYGGNLHWGKSGGHLFDGLAKRTVNLPKFLMVKKKLDPQGLFSNDWTDALLGLRGKKVEILKKGCALEKLCKCREDIHCAPDKGYLCKPGQIWKNARVCRKSN